MKINKSKSIPSPESQLPAADSYFRDFGKTLIELHSQLENLPAKKDSPVDKIKNKLEEAIIIIACELYSNMERSHRAKTLAKKK